MVYILYNPHAMNGEAKKYAEETAKRFKNEGYELKSLIGLDVKGLAGNAAENDKLVICGGDGTLNRFANDIGDVVPECGVYLAKCGTGNDFFNDIGGLEDIVKINEYLKNLPEITVNGTTRRFINGIGYGIDGMACETADKMRAAGKKNINYTSISIKLLLFHYKCPNARVTVDGVTREYKKVWLCSAMKGRYYGGGMKIAPDQDRSGGFLTNAVVHSSGRLKTLMIFPGIFKGEHIKHKDIVSLSRGREITVEFDSPMALQIDGETVLNVKEYSVKIPEYETAAVK